METSIILAKSFTSSNSVPIRKNPNNFKIKVRPTQGDAMLDLNGTISVTSKPDSILGSTNHTYWNSSDYFYTTTSTPELEYDYQILNETSGEGSWAGSCKEWTPAQHNLFQTANFFFAAAFLVPGSFKQSILIVRALLSIGYFFSTIWGGLEVCAPDILLWNFIIVLLNATHTALLTWKFLPPTLTLELTDLYLKVFKPLRVSKKHFKELVKEAKVLNLEEGDIYAVEDVSPADEKLSILLRGRLRVTCDDTHLHFISAYQFVDSPEWEANHEQSEDVFQVTISAEEDSVYLCWPRMKLERVLRHRPMLKSVFEAIIGKDITQKLYALNEHLNAPSEERDRVQNNQLWAKTHNRSMSLDAVNTSTTGLVRSQAYKNSQRGNIPNSEPLLSKMDRRGGDGEASFKERLSRTRMLDSQISGLLGKSSKFVPLVASQFPAKSPFTHENASFRRSETNVTPQRTRSLRHSIREVKFEISKK